VSGANVLAVNFTAQAVTAGGGVTLIQDNVNGNEIHGIDDIGLLSSCEYSRKFPDCVSGTIARPGRNAFDLGHRWEHYIPVTTSVTDTNQDVTSYLMCSSCKGGSTPSDVDGLRLQVRSRFTFGVVRRLEPPTRWTSLPPQLELAQKHPVVFRHNHWQNGE